MVVNLLAGILLIFIPVKPTSLEPRGSIRCQADEHEKHPLFLLFLAAFVAVSVTAQNNDADWQHGPIRNVQLISVDGLHAVDFLNCSHGLAGVNGGAPYCPNLAALGTTGVNYTATSTSKPSDSFPGLMHLVTGATPRTMGIYYDVAYDRTLSPPVTTTGNGNAGGKRRGIPRSDRPRFCSFLDSAVPQPLRFETAVFVQVCLSFSAR
jgi:hypothetical protein